MASAAGMTGLILAALAWWSLPQCCRGQILKCKAAKVLSVGGTSDHPSGIAEFWFDNERVPFLPGVGVNVVSIEPVAQQILTTKTYDTPSDPNNEDAALSRDLQALPRGTIVLVAVMGTGLENLDGKAQEALRSVGATVIAPEARDGYALIGSKGGRAIAEHLGHSVEVKGPIPCRVCSSAKIFLGWLHAKLGAEIHLGNQVVDMKPTRGLNVIKVDAVTEKVVSSDTYDLDGGTVVEEQQRFVQDVSKMPTGQMVVIVSWTMNVSHFSKDGLIAMGSLGATLKFVETSQGYVFIGSKNGWAVEEKSGMGITVDVDLPCQEPGKIPAYLPDASFPGRNTTASEHAWPMGYQPKDLQEWPKDNQRRPKPCWKIRSFEDKLEPWPDQCLGMRHTPVDTEAGCRMTCYGKARCSIYQFATVHGVSRCWKADGRSCGVTDGFLANKPLDAFWVQHGDVRVLRSLRGLEVFHLFKLGKYRGGDDALAAERCKQWCYANVDCQYWQYGNGGCRVEDIERMDKPVVFPLILGEGASATTDFAKSVIAGEYIQHFCPPKPMALQVPFQVMNPVYVPTSEIITATPGPPIRRGGYWLDEKPAHDWPCKTPNASQAAWKHGKQPPPLAAWPKKKDGRLSACGLTKVLADHEYGWEARCVGLKAFQAKTVGECREACLWNATCPTWEMVGGACQHGDGIHCTWGVDSGGPVVEAAQRLQHGAVRVLKIIDHLEIIGLTNIGMFSDASPQQGIARCRNWCYTNVYCEFWQYGVKGCWVDAADLMMSSVQYPLTLSGGASKDSEFAKKLIAGEYIQHYCPEEYVVRDGHTPKFNLTNYSQSEDTVELHFDADYNTVDKDKFKEEIKKQLKAKGVPPEVIEHLKITLKPGSIVVVIKGQAGSVDKVRSAPLHHMKVMGYGQKDHDHKEATTTIAPETTLPQTTLPTTVVTTVVTTVAPTTVAPTTLASTTPTTTLQAITTKTSTLMTTHTSTQDMGAIVPLTDKKKAPVPITGDDDYDDDDQDGHANWIAPVVLCVMLVFCCTVLSRLILPLKSKRTPGVYEMPSDLFRLSATKDRYDYYQPMESADGASTTSPLPSRDRQGGQKIIVVLEKAALEQAVTLISGRARKDVEYELQITHECLIAMMDSPLNKAGRLQVFLHSARGTLIEVNPSLRIPRAFKNFTQLIYDLLRSGEIYGQDSTTPLMKRIAGPVEQYFPRDAKTIGLTPTGRPVKLRDFAMSTEANGNESIVFAIGASEGDAILEPDFGEEYTTDKVSICPWGLRAACCCQMVCYEFESVWNVCVPNVPDSVALVQEVPARSNMKLKT